MVRRWPRALRSTLAFASVAGALVLVSPAVARAAQPCAQQVLRDWSADGVIDDRYDVACYRDALRSLPEDVRLYSSAADDIKRALARRVSTRSVALAHEQRDAGQASPVIGGGGGGFPGAPLGLALGLTAAGLVVGAVLTVVLRRLRRRSPGLPA